MARKRHTLASRTHRPPTNPLWIKYYRIESDRRYALKLHNRLNSQCNVPGVARGHYRPDTVLFDSVHQLGECQVCLGVVELHNTCPTHSACKECIRKYVICQLPTRHMKCVGCSEEMSVEAVNVSVSLDEMSQVSDHYDRRAIPYTHVPSRCPHCHIQVEKIDGCSGVLCCCGTGFCYRCGRHLRDCDGLCYLSGWGRACGRVLYYISVIALLFLSLFTLVCIENRFLMHRVGGSNVHRIVSVGTNTSDGDYDTNDTAANITTTDAGDTAETDTKSCCCKNSAELSKALASLETASKRLLESLETGSQPRCFTAYPFMGMTTRIVCW